VACDVGAESAMMFLTAWCDKLVLYKNSKGETPLHRAIARVEDTKTLWSVRHLLLKGSSRTDRDMLGRSPSDLAS
jgi:hypothetical protein